MVDYQDGSRDNDIANGPCEYSYRQLIHQESNNTFDTDSVAQEMGLEPAGSFEETEVVASVSNKSLKDKTGLMWRTTKQLKATFSVTTTILKYVYMHTCSVPLYCLNPLGPV